MSGGSYNYLCYADGYDLLTKRSDLESMVKRLETLAPESKAHKDTVLLLETVEAINRTLNNLVLGNLQKVFHDVEWADSGDWSEEDALQSIQEYETQGNTP